MKVDISKELHGRGNFMSHFILHVVSPVFDAAKKNGERVDPANLDLVVTINGVEVDALSFVQNIEDQMDRMVQDEARKILREKFDPAMLSLAERMREFEHEFVDYARTLLPKASWGEYPGRWGDDD